MADLRVLEISPDWIKFQILTFSTCLVLILLEIHLARRKDRTGAGPYAFARKDKIRRRFSVAIFSILAIVCLFVVCEFHLAHLEDSPLEVLDRVDTDEVSNGIKSRYFHHGLPPFALMHLRSWSRPMVPTDDLLAAKIQSYRHYWWTQQYLAGFLNFALFLQMQTRVRTLRAHTALSFAWIALTSLSAAECLLFLYITLTPPAKNQKRFKANWMMGSILPILGVIINIGRLPDAVGTDSFELLMWICVGVPVALSFASVVIPKESMWRMGFVSVHQAQTRVWLPSAAAAFVLHVVSTSETFWSHVPDGAHIRWAIWRHLLEEGFFQRANMAVKNVIRALGEDPAIGGVGWDVLLSSAVLSLWAFISNVSTRGMLRCTLFPGIKTYQISFLDEQKERSSPKRKKSDDSTTSELSLREIEVDSAEEEASYLRYNATRSKSPFAEFLDARNANNTETAQGTALSLALGFLGGLGVQSAGVFGAGAKRLDA